MNLDFAENYTCKSQMEVQRSHWHHERVIIHLIIANYNCGKNQVEVDGTLLYVEASFCDLGDMLRAGGGCALAIATRCSTAWGKCRKLLPILTSKHVSPLTRGKVFSACIG